MSKSGERPLDSSDEDAAPPAAAASSRSSPVASAASVAASSRGRTTTAPGPAHATSVDESRSKKHEQWTVQDVFVGRMVRLFVTAGRDSAPGFVDMRITKMRKVEQPREAEFCLWLCERVPVADCERDAAVSGGARGGSGGGGGAVNAGADSSVVGGGAGGGGTDGADRAEVEGGDKVELTLDELAMALNAHERQLTKHMKEQDTHFCDAFADDTKWFTGEWLTYVAHNNETITRVAERAGVPRAHSAHALVLARASVQLEPP